MKWHNLNSNKIFINMYNLYLIPTIKELFNSKGKFINKYYYFYSIFTIHFKTLLFYLKPFF